MHPTFARSAPLALCLIALAACGANRAVAYTPASSPPPAADAPGPASWTVAPAPPPPPASAAAAAPASATLVAPVVVEPTERPGLATTWGETTWSPITTTPFVRASTTPWATAVLHYNDADGVAAHAAHLGAGLAPVEALAGDGDLAIAILDERGAVLPGVAAAGRTLLAARDGERYRIAVRNHTTARFEIVASVDGLDVIDGRPASTTRRGYVVEPHDELIIDGFRQSDAEVAAFRFGKVAASYAARTGDDRDVGVIGVAVFAERGARWTRAELERRDQAQPFPGDRDRAFAARP